MPADRWNADEFYDPTGETPGKMSVRWAALIDRPGPIRSAVLRHHAARSGADGPAAAAAAGSGLGSDGERGPAGRSAGRHAGPACSSASAAPTTRKSCVPYDDYYQQIDAHMGTGNALSIAANRLSYIFDFHGPSAAVDTACSSSSLAIHFAVESLRRGESDAALAGGVNMILTPETTIAFSKARMLSPEGVCRPFDARANGYVRGEGCGLVLLKRLADAERDGDNILAVLRATSVNQDGRTSGISAPNSQSQMACIRAALKQAGLTPDDIGYIEAHGTGTPLGDPIEMQALSEIFRDGRRRGAAVLRVEREGERRAHGNGFRRGGADQSRAHDAARRDRAADAFRIAQSAHQSGRHAAGDSDRARRLAARRAAAHRRGQLVRLRRHEYASDRGVAARIDMPNAGSRSRRPIARCIC